MISASSVFAAFLGGILPALLWLWFWLREDRNSPEPRRLIINTFLAGMAVVLVAFFLERGVSQFMRANSFGIIILWAFIEEISKFGAAYYMALRTRENDEPIDAMIYLITAALGFAALENTFFLLMPLGDGNFANFLITGNLRFIGSSLLHIIASGVIGIFAAYSYCEMPGKKRLFLALGLILAVLLHGFFNFFILKGDNNLFLIFGFVWVGVILLILFFERVKRIDRTCVISN